MKDEVFAQVLMNAIGRARAALDDVEALVFDRMPCQHNSRQEITRMGEDHRTFICADCGATFVVPFMEEP